MPLPYRSVLDAPAIRRVRVTPDNPGDFPQRAPRTRRPHGEAQVAAVRYLIEQTTLTYSEIEKKTGVGRASICRWTSDHKWVRPVFAPRATDTVPRARASAKLKRRTLAARLDALAERYVHELEADSSVDLDKLAAALELAKMAKLAARPRKRRGTLAHAHPPSTIPALSPPVVPAKAGTQWQTHESAAEILSACAPQASTSTAHPKPLCRTSSTATARRRTTARSTRAGRGRGASASMRGCSIGDGIRWGRLHSLSASS